MPNIRNTLELLAPAKNAEFGIEAISHGADAVYIGGPAFGARVNAGNSVADIERLASHAHRFNARVLVAINTLLKDDELEEAQRLIWEFYEAGADALIVQDMGLLELDLPPIELHASTQTDIRTPEKARFLEDVGFSQIVLARELSLQQIRKIAAHTTATLEFFVHGALCVSYSGLCNISHAQTGRSANRGDCSQACRLPYSLADQEGRILAEDKHLLSMKDNDQSDNLRALIEAGIRSFKIEGRLKDLSYVKNITAHYRRQLDDIIEDLPSYRRSSSGVTTLFFTPQTEKTFNRGATDYFLNDRKSDIGAFDSPKFVGEKIGTVIGIGHDSIDVCSDAPLHNGDGITCFDADLKLVGLRINRAQQVASGYRIFPTPGEGRFPTDLRIGETIYRNHDQEFVRQLEKKSAERSIRVRMRFEETSDGFALRITDDEGVGAAAHLKHDKKAANNPELAMTRLRENLGKLGNTIYRSETIDLAIDTAWFIPDSVLNALRRAAVEALDAARNAAYKQPERRAAMVPPAPYPDDALSYLGNVLNAKARAFYEKHGVSVIAPAYECNAEKGEVSLMITKHCLRYSFNLCPKQVKGIRPDPMILINGNEKLTLRFDCKPCEMHVIGKLRKNRTIQLAIR
ncbi:putative peptidase [Candidatus Propionivibrio aalborgensis]|uniref:Putative peptidase n=1 Tax=Candidatus Propionivibrio aalborgensis TaxID=1860101 RepID=A0A1A8Y1X4_9RHOO|nr:U32 family peptidase [Candidatus Propionivibrio aalborgensis]SBT10373.1 putative peptidase [Candidatus Propionivibrio aalborgensis]